MESKMNGFRGLFMGFAILTILSFLSLFFASCTKEPVDEGQSPIVFNPTITATQTVNGGIATVLWSSKNATLVTCNGVTVALTGDVSFPVSDSILTFVAKNEKLEATEQIQVKKPAEPTMTVGQVPAELPYRHNGYEKITFNLHLTNTTKVECNGDAYQVVGETYTLTVDPNNFTDTATYIIKAIGDGGQVSQTVKIALGKPSATQLLEIAVSNNECVWKPYRRDDDFSGIRQDHGFVSDIDRQFLLIPSPRHLVYAYEGGYAGGVTNNITWKMNTDSTFSVGSNTEEYKIESINPNELIIRVKFMYYGQFHYIWDYYHPIYVK